MVRVAMTDNCLALTQFTVIENKHSCFTPGRMEPIVDRAQHVNIV
jgi:hypothetical protein